MRDPLKMQWRARERLFQRKGDSMLSECDMYVSGMSIPEVSRVTGVPRSNLWRMFKTKGILRSRVEGVRLAEKKGLIPRTGNTKPREWGTRMKSSESHLARWEGVAVGFCLKKNGYVEFTRGLHKGRYVHVVIMEEKIGRKIRKGELVHHCDYNRSNNHESNLILMSRSSHASLHATNIPRSRNKKGQFI
jgi:hypothetical protein